MRRQVTLSLLLSVACGARTAPATGDHFVLDASLDAPSTPFDAEPSFPDAPADVPRDVPTDGQSDATVDTPDADLLGPCDVDSRVGATPPGVRRTRIGPPAVNPADLGGVRVLRTVRASLQGERHSVARGGVVDGVEVSAWSGDAGSLRVDLVLHCASGPVVVRTSRVSSSSLPRYDGIRSPRDPVTLPIDPPLRIRAGDVLDVALSAPDDTLVFGLWKNDRFPDGVFFAEDESGLPESADEWDAAASLLVYLDP